MFEFVLLVSFLFLFYLFFVYLYPLIKKYMNYRQEREQLVKQYNRVWRCRKDMLVIYLFFLIDP